MERGQLRICKNIIQTETQVIHKNQVTNYIIMEKTISPDELWRIQKAKLLLRFSQLDEGDFRYNYGMKDVMMSKLQVKLGKSRAELSALLQKL
jgi:hypothetical protein